MTRRLSELVLLVLLAEAVGLPWYCRRTGRGPTTRAILGSVGAGAFLCLALRAEARRDAPARVASCLALAGLFHLFDLRGRWGDTR